MLPMMAGMLTTSIAPGSSSAATGRYKVFPIVGTAVLTIGLFLLSRLDPDTIRAVDVALMLVVGLGLGLVMQVLVLAVQNAVDYDDLGVGDLGRDPLPLDRRLARHRGARRGLRRPADRRARRHGGRAA